MNRAANGPDERLLHLAALLEVVGDELRDRDGLAGEVLGDPAVADSAELAPVTWGRVEEALSSIASGEHGLRARADELDADAALVRATVRSHRWLTELQGDAEQAWGPATARGVGRLVPELPLGGVETPRDPIGTSAPDRGELGDLIADHPDLVDRAAGRSGLLEGLLLRSQLHVPMPDADRPTIARDGLAAIGAGTFSIEPAAALRDIAGRERPRLAAPASERPAGLRGLMSLLLAATRAVTVLRTAPGVYVVLLPGEQGRPGDVSDQPGLQLVGGDRLPYADRAIRAIEAAIHRQGDHRAGEPARVLLAGAGPGGATALDVAALAESDLFGVDRVVTTGAPSALVPRAPRYTRMISLEDRSDPATLLGSLVNAGADNRLTLIFDGAGSSGPERYLAAAHAADVSEHPDLLEELRSLRELGYLA